MLLTTLTNAAPAAQMRHQALVAKTRQIKAYQIKQVQACRVSIDST